MGESTTEQRGIFFSKMPSVWSPSALFSDVNHEMDVGSAWLGPHGTAGHTKVNEGFVFQLYVCSPLYTFYLLELKVYKIIFHCNLSNGVTLTAKFFVRFFLPPPMFVVFLHFDFFNLRQPFFSLSLFAELCFESRRRAPKVHCSREGFLYFKSHFFFLA